MIAINMDDVNNMSFSILSGDDVVCVYTIYDVWSEITMNDDDRL